MLSVVPIATTSCSIPVNVGSQESRESLTRSCVVEPCHRTCRKNEKSDCKQKDFSASVHVVASDTGRYKVYKPSRSGEGCCHGNNVDTDKCSVTSDMSLKTSKCYAHNISNPNLRKMSERKSLRNIVNKSLVVTRSKTEESEFSARSSKYDFTRSARFADKISSKDFPLKAGRKYGNYCTCNKYHRHTFSRPIFNRTRTNSIKECSDLDYILRCRKLDFKLEEANKKHLILCNSFWRPALSMSSYLDGDNLIEFMSLWQDESVLKDWLRDGMQNTVLKSAILELAILAIVAGPLHLLKCLLSLKLVRVDSVLENGAGLLHHACLIQRQDLIHYLVSEGVSPSLRDQQGNTADQMCFCPKLRKSLPAKFLVSTANNSSRSPLLQTSVQDRELIFRLAGKSNSLYYLQKILQTFEFNVNTECNSQGDFLIHTATQGGLCMLPMILVFLRIQNADIELCNSSGMTPLMIAAADGNTILCDTLMCVMGAAPNKPNVHTGRTALHYAVQLGQVDCVSCLIRRGADVNIEDYGGKRPDDFQLEIEEKDCVNIIKSHRLQRCEQLTQLTIQGKLRQQDLRETDIGVVDPDGFTLLMVAALYNRVDSLKLLLDLDTRGTSLNSQYVQVEHSIIIFEGLKTGMTALSMATFMGHSLCASMLLQRGANCAIVDIDGYTPLQCAVLRNHEDVVAILLEEDFFPRTYTGLFKALRICRKTSIYTVLKRAHQKRQDEIVTPNLLQCSMSGDAAELFCLLEEGDNINSESGVGNWPLYLAVENGCLDVVRLLCERGANIRRRHGTTESTVLHVAAKMGQHDILEYLLTFSGHQKEDRLAGQRALDINAFDGEEKTALQLAAEKGFTKVVRTLLSYGATTALLDCNGLLFSLPEFGGVCSEIETHRQCHTEYVMKCIREKSKRNIEMLQKVFLPRFDHNLRDKNFDTPLMVACRHGKQEVVDFLLQSAVYPEGQEEDFDGNSDTLSEVDSGMLDLTNGSCTSSKGEEDSFRAQCYLEYTNAENFGSKISSTYNSSRPVSRLSNRPSNRLENLLHDVDKPKGLLIYHDGVVSHVCAVNLFDGSTPLHRALEGGDNPKIVESLIASDCTCINTQNAKGMSPLHIACKQNRKKSLENILSVESLDLNLYTLNGQLAEEMTSNKAIIRMVQHTRKGKPVRRKTSFVEQPSGPSSLVDSSASPGQRPGSMKTMATSIDLDKVHKRFETLKQTRNVSDPCSKDPHVLTSQI